MSIHSKERFFQRRALHVLLILVFGFLAYSNTFHSPFQWDEAVYLKDKPYVRDFSYFVHPSRVSGTDGLALKSRYIGYLSFALDYKLHGFDVFGYHVVNLAIHLINALLVYFLVLFTLRTPYFNYQRSAISDNDQREEAKDSKPASRQAGRLGDSRLFALAIALLFVSHPLQTEAVTYVFQRLASLVTLFYLLSLVLYIKGRLASDRLEVRGQRTEDEAVRASYLVPQSSYVFYFLSFISAICAMKTKENAFTLPVIITLYEFLFFTGSLKRRLIRLTPFLLTMLIIPVTVFGQGGDAEEAIAQLQDPSHIGFAWTSWKDYLFTQFRVIVTYIRLLLLPVKQNLYHDYPLYRSFFTPPVFLSFLFLVGIFGIGLYLIFRSRQAGKLASRQAEMKESYRTAVSEAHETDFLPPTSNLQPVAFYYRLVGFGILWFFITLSVESSIMPIPMLIDEYRVYLPSVGFFIAALTAVWVLINRVPGIRQQKLKAATALLGIVILVLASAAYARNSLWKDKVSLWEDVVAKSPNFPLGYNNLGIAYYEKGLYEKAIRTYKKAIALFPVYLDAYINLGASYSAAGRNDMAVAVYSRALEMYPGNGTLYFNIARSYALAGQPGKAVENYLMAIRLEPYNSGAYHGLGTVYERLGRFDDAIAAYTKFAELSPDNPEAYRNRGLAYMRKRDFRSALADFEMSCSLGSAAGCDLAEHFPVR